MQRVQLAGTPVECSVLGFGCASLTAHGNDADAVRILDTALERGVTHFDTARLYGHGQAEAILGKFLKGKRDRVTVTTKFGLQASGAITRSRKLMSLARWAVHRSGVLKKLAKRARAAAPGGGMQQGVFSPADAAASLDTSLRELGTDHVDLYLLHECSLADAMRDDLISHLENEVRRGRVRAFGTAAAFSKLGEEARGLPQAYRVVQFNSTALNRNVERMRGATGDRAMVTHGALPEARRLAELVKQDPGRWSLHAAQTGIDLTDAGLLAGFLLRDAVQANAGGMVLFATTSAARVRENIANLDDPRGTPDRQAAFMEFALEAARDMRGGAE